MENLTYLLIGANLGEREETLLATIEAISEKVGEVLAISSLYETEPWGVENQSAYLNQALIVKTELSAHDLLRTNLAIEESLGRVRTEKWASRTIDIDILFYNHVEIATEDLQIPHPRLQDRRFALVPLVEIAPKYWHPVLGKTNEELLEECQDSGEVTLYQA